MHLTCSFKIAEQSVESILSGYLTAEQKYIITEETGIHP